MAKYLAKAKYTQKGLQGLLLDGGSKRREVVNKLMDSLGGKIEAFYYAFGDTDLYIIFDAPDNVSMATGALIVAAAGGADANITVLLTPEEIDEVSKKSAIYESVRFLV